MKRVRKVDIDYVLRASQLFTKSPIKKGRTAPCTREQREKSTPRRKPLKVKCFSLLLRNFHPKMLFRSTISSKTEMKGDWQKERETTTQRCVTKGAWAAK